MIEVEAIEVHEQLPDVSGSAFHLSAAGAYLKRWLPCNLHNKFDEDYKGSTGIGCPGKSHWQFLAPRVCKDLPSIFSSLTNVFALFAGDECAR